MSTTSSQQIAQPRFSRRIYQMQIPIFIVSIIGGFLLIEYFGSPYKPVTDAKTNMLLANTILVAFGDVFGYTVLIMMHVRRLASNRDRPEYRRTVIKSGTVLATCLSFLAIALATGGIGSKTYTFWYAAIPAMTAVSANMVWVFHAYTPFRMFRITSLETALFFITWLLTCTGEMTGLVTLWPPFAVLADWMRTVPNSAAQRASLLAAAVGSIVMAVRALLGREPGLVEMEVK